MSGSHYANPPEQRGAEICAVPEYTVYDMAAVRDLRTMAEREADDVAALTARVEALETMVLSFIAHVAGMSDEQARDTIGSAETTPAVVLSARCEERLAALEQAQARQADALTVMQLREGL